MVLTLSMTTTKNVQGYEPRATTLEDKYRPSSRPWNASLSRTTIWKSSYAKGMWDTATRKKTKKVPVSSDETERDRKVVTPQAYWSDKI